LLKSILDEEQIACEIRNEGVHANLPGAAFQPEIWVVSDDDYPRACEVRDAWQSPVSAEPSLVTMAEIQSARSSHFVISLTGFLLLLASLVLGWRLAHLEDWGRLGGVVVCFGLPGALLLWGGAQLRQRGKR